MGHTYDSAAGGSWKVTLGACLVRSREEQEVFSLPFRGKIKRTSLSFSLR